MWVPAAPGLHETDQAVALVEPAAPFVGEKVSDPEVRPV